MSKLIKKFQNFSFQENLWKKGDKIVLGVSSGPDSMCLLDIFLKLEKKYSLRLIVAHVNYNLRGKDSQKDEELVKKICQEKNLKLEIFRPRKKFKSNLEANLRNARYDFFEEVREKYKFDLIAVAHHADDQVETFFLNLLRGSGQKGLSGIRSQNKKVIRPLLFCFKDEVLVYLKENKITYRIDKTNNENEFTRNKVRNRLIPYLEKNFNPNIKKTILRTTENLSKKENQSFITIIKEIKGNLKGVTSAHIREIDKIIKSKKNKIQTFNFQGLKIERRGDKITIVKNKE